MRASSAGAFLLATWLLLGSSFASPAGAPTRPDLGPPKTAGLAAHALTYAPGPLDNPLKGFVPFYEPGKTYEKKYPHSMEWAYFALNDLMRDFDAFDWAPLERMLDEVAGRGRQSVMRVYIEYPGRASGIPDFLRKSGVAIRKVPQWNTESPDYDDARTQRALTNFIRAFGKKYDGDPRIGFVTTGLVGLWGEWHLWPADQLFPKPESVEHYIDAFDQAFDQTQIEIRYARLAKGYPVRKNIGFHDDSMFYRDTGKGVTLPRSLGGQDWAFLQEMLDFGGENRWIEQSVGGEARPEIQRALFTDSKTIDDPTACVELSHVSWLMNQRGIATYQKEDPQVAALVRRMGYELYVSEARYSDVKAGAPLQVDITMENRGVAPFYYPWRVAVGVADQNHRVVRSWYTTWDLRQVKPLTIRAFPDWKLPGQPREIPFGAPRNFSFTEPAPKLAPGKYQLLMRVVHPLEQSLGARGGARPLPVRFANETELPSGWLALGELTVKP